jgi:hypothetical protein
VTDPTPPHELDYATPPRQPAARQPLAGLILFACGVLVSVGNLASIIHEGGESFFAPALGMLSLLLFAAGAVASALHRERRRPPVLGPQRRGAPVLVLLNLAGIVASLILSCGGMPRR